MATPRKYPTLAEFEALKEAVARIETGMTTKPTRASVWVNAEELAERMGIVDAYGVPVAVGDDLQQIDGDTAHRINCIIVRAATQDGMATVTVGVVNGQGLTAVDMRLPGHVVSKKVTA